MEDYAKSNEELAKGQEREETLNNMRRKTINLVEFDGQKYLVDQPHVLPTRNHTQIKNDNTSVGVTLENETNQTAAS